MAESYTNRGFGIYTELKDRYGANIRVQQSSTATEDCVWLFVEGGQVDKNDGSAHLNVEMAKQVRDALDAFIQDFDEKPKGY